MKKILLLFLVVSGFSHASHPGLTHAVKTLDVKAVRELLVSGQIDEEDRLGALEQVTEMIEKPDAISRLLNLGQLVSSSVLVGFAGRFITNTIIYNQDPCAYMDFTNQFWAGAPAKVLVSAERNPLIFNTPLIAASGALFVLSAQSLIKAVKKLMGKDDKHMKAIAIQCMLSIA